MMPWRCLPKNAHAQPGCQMRQEAPALGARTGLMHHKCSDMHRTQSCCVAAAASADASTHCHVHHEEDPHIIQSHLCHVCLPFSIQVYWDQRMWETQEGLPGRRRPVRCSLEGSPPFSQCTPCAAALGPAQSRPQTWLQTSQQEFNTAQVCRADVPAPNTVR